jgi:hypothetical protein
MITDQSPENPKVEILSIAGDNDKFSTPRNNKESTLFNFNTKEKEEQPSTSSNLPTSNFDAKQGQSKKLLDIIKKSESKRKEKLQSSISELMVKVHKLKKNINKQRFSSRSRSP